MPVNLIFRIMKINNLLNRNFSLMVVFVLALFYSCSSDFEDVENKTDDLSMKSTSSYDMVVESREFKAYDSECANFISIIRESVNRMSQEEQDEFSNLIRLYLSEPQKYESLLKYRFDNSVFGQDSVRINKSSVMLLKARDNLMKNKIVCENIKKNESAILARLKENLGNPDDVGFYPMIKTRTEDGKQKCLNLCKEQLDADINHAYLVMSCGTVANIAACVFSLGVSVPVAGFNQALLITYYGLEENKAKADYERCKRGC